MTNIFRSVIYLFLCSSFGGPVLNTPPGGSINRPNFYQHKTHHQADMLRYKTEMDVTVFGTDNKQ